MGGSARSGWRSGARSFTFASRSELRALVRASVEADLSAAILRAASRDLMSPKRVEREAVRERTSGLGLLDNLADASGQPAGIFTFWRPFRASLMPLRMSRWN